MEGIAYELSFRVASRTHITEEEEAIASVETRGDYEGTVLWKPFGGGKAAASLIYEDLCV